MPEALPETADQVLDAGYALDCRNQRRLGFPLVRRSYCARRLGLYGDQAALHGIAHEGQIVAAVRSMSGNGVIDPYCSGATEHAGRLGIDHAMDALLMADAAGRGCRLFDVRRSRVGAGPASCHRNMGVEPTPLIYQFDLPNSAPPNLNPSTPKTALPRRIHASLPMGMARAVGPALMRDVR